ncbi:MAG TPA: peptide transporter, partial [Armatimonadetes bacterium]|nr:peptide transporter [Armatimonadota bacterium]
TLSIAGGYFGWMIYNQYFAYSQAAKGFGISGQVPTWVVPPEGSMALIQRTFLHPDWAIPIALAVGTSFVERLSWYGFGYTLFRVTSDKENLPFPMAPIAAQGVTALAEITSKTETWRWRLFSVGAMVGVAFGVVYVGIPAISGVLLTQPIQLLPIPFLDLTQRTEAFLPATATGITLNIGSIITGAVIPFWAVVGSFIAAAGTFVLNPALYRMGMLPTWRYGMDAIQTGFANNVDFYLSWGLGIALAIALVSFIDMGIEMARESKARRATARAERSVWMPPPPKGRGDIPIPVAISLWAFATTFYIFLCRILIPNFPWAYFVFFGFIWTPVISYVSARVRGIAGQYIGIPFEREAAFILSGYKGVDIWFAPIPLNNYAGLAEQFRVVELTGTRFTSIIWAEVWMFPIILFASFFYWQFLWKIAEIPSVQYPYAQKFWQLQALNQALWYTATAEGNSYLLRALKLPIISTAFGSAAIAYWLFNLFRLPITAIFGFIRGLGYLPMSILPEIIGAITAQFYLIPRFGAKQWKLYATVISAGFSCGMGLIGMASVAIAMIQRSVTQLPF